MFFCLVGHYNRVRSLEFAIKLCFRVLVLSLLLDFYSNLDRWVDYYEERIPIRCLF